MTDAGILEVVRQDDSGVWTCWKLSQDLRVRDYSLVTDAGILEVFRQDDSGVWTCWRLSQDLRLRDYSLVTDAGILEVVRQATLLSGPAGGVARTSGLETTVF